MRCAGFSVQWLLSLQSTGSSSSCLGFSSCNLWALEHRLSSWGTWACVLLGMWNLPRPGDPRPLHWQVDSYPPCKRKVPGSLFLSGERDQQTHPPSHNYGCPPPISSKQVFLLTCTFLLYSLLYDFSGFDFAEYSIESILYVI